MGEALALDAEPLAIVEVPSQHVQLDRRHAIDIALEDIDGNEVPANVDQRALPHEARLIVNRDRGTEKPLGVMVMSCRKVSSPRRSPSGLGALSLAPDSVTIRS